MLKKLMINILFLCSILFIVYLTMFPESSLTIGVNLGGINLIPFHTILDLFFHHSFSDFVINNLGNIILFVPFGFMIALKFKKMRTLSKVCLIGMSVSIVIECIQLSMLYRWTDIDDVILNTGGASIGYYLFTAKQLWVNHSGK